MVNGGEWKNYFKKKSPAYLKRLRVGLSVILSDPMLKKEYGEVAGLDTIDWFIEQIIREKGMGDESQRPIITGSCGKKRKR